MTCGCGARNANGNISCGRCGAELPRLDELDDEALVDWLAEWGHGWPRRFLDFYGREVVDPELVRLVGSHGQRASWQKPAFLVANVRHAAGGHDQ